jgi:hypothetical protein
VLELRFAPSAIEASTGRLVIANSAGGVRGVDLTGNGIGRPAIDVTPAQVDFGIVKRGAGVKPRRVKIANAGTEVLLLRSPRIEGDGRFSMGNNCPERLAPKAQCFVDIGFDASGAGNAGARLIVAHSAAGGPAIVALSAAIEAMPPPVIERFDSDPQVLERPRNIQLCFRARNAQQLTIEPGGTQPQSNSAGCVTRFIRDTTTFTLIARGEGGPPLQASWTVTVAGAPPPPPPTPRPVIVDFRANPPLLKRPGETRLCFAAQNAERAVIEPGGPQPSSSNEGCVSRSLSATTTFTLTVSRKGAPSQQRATTVTVVTTPDSTDVPGAGTPRDGPVKGGGVITKDVGVLKKPGALGAVELVGGWCCRSGSVIRTRKSECSGAGQQWFGTEAEANQACAPFRAPR